ncbi:metal ABC transporter substrate-binding protein [Hamadaea sp. NPDC051192]|uniref:metal ABC transporter substrate-binding protein n=1 Tax=Hamadaea sp. NPDC051192 TaxID=3154940 RepID=UPI00343FFE26
MRLRHLLSVATAGVLLAGGLAACGQDGASADGKLPVVAAFYPLQFVAQRIGGDAVQVTNLTAPGAEPHDLELSPKQLMQIAEAKVVLYLKGFQPEVDKAIDAQAKDKAIDVLTLVPTLTAAGEEAAETPELQGKDPHVWLDPTRLSTIAATVAAKFTAADPAHQAQFADNAAKLAADLAELDMEFATGLKTCQRKEIFTSHAAFGYLADRYHLTQIALTGLDPEQEPTAQSLADIAAEAKKYGATTIFSETLVSPKISETIAKEVGAKTAVLDPLEGLPAGSTGDYLSVMRQNLTALQSALGCS